MNNNEYRKRMPTWDDVQIIAGLNGITLPEEAKQHEIDIIRGFLHDRYASWHVRVTNITSEDIKRLDDEEAPARLDAVEDL